jgi:hypothetical protein
MHPAPTFNGYQFKIFFLVLPFLKELKRKYGNPNFNVDRRKARKKGALDLLEILGVFQSRPYIIEEKCKKCGVKQLTWHLRKSEYKGGEEECDAYRIVSKRTGLDINKIIVNEI